MFQDKQKESVKQGLVLEISPPTNSVRKVPSVPSSRPKNEIIQRRSIATSGATNTRPGSNTLVAAKPLKSVAISSTAGESSKSRVMPPPMKSESVRPKTVAVNCSPTLEETDVLPEASAELDEQIKKDVKMPLASKRLVSIVFLDALSFCIVYRDMPKEIKASEVT